MTLHLVVLRCTPWHHAALNPSTLVHCVTQHLPALHPPSPRGQALQEGAARSGITALPGSFKCPQDLAAKSWDGNGAAGAELQGMGLSCTCPGTED